MQIIALGAAYIVAVTALDTVTNVGAIDDLTSTARIVLVRALGTPLGTGSLSCPTELPVPPAAMAEGPS